MFDIIIFKPGVLSRKLVHKFLQPFEEGNFSILHMEMRTLSSEEVLKFYSHVLLDIVKKHIVPYMLSDKVIIIVFEGENSIYRIRKIVGSTNPDAAYPSTLRMRFAESMEANLIHSSSSTEDFENEIKILNIKL